MRKNYRFANNKNYWEKRWSEIPADLPMENLSVYPIKYANLTIANDKGGKILEAGCGAGRVLRYFHNRGYKIKGFDFIKVAIDKLKEVDATLDVEVGDITDVKYPDASFKYVLSFGLYHNLDDTLDQAIAETYRILEVNGKVCASFRADNIQTKLTDWHANRRENVNNKNTLKKSFHKMNLTKKEFIKLFENKGFNIRVCRVS